MRRAKLSGSFILCLLFNMLMNLEGLIPAAVLLILHFLFDWSIWWSVLAAALWIVMIILWMLFIGWSGRCGSTPDTPKENKNPYSVGNKKDLKTEKDASEAGQQDIENMVYRTGVDIDAESSEFTGKTIRDKFNDAYILQVC